MKKYYTIEELEEGLTDILPISRRTQARYRKVGLLPYIKIGRRIFYSKTHIEQLFKALEAQTVQKEA
jgi:hypothetical protein